MILRAEVWLSLISILFLSCDINKKNKELDDCSFIAASTNYHVDSSIYKTASIFYDSLKDKNSIKELFIDKIYEDQIILTYRAKPIVPNYFKKNKPSYILYLQPNILFYVYTGIEDLLIGDLRHTDKIEVRDVISDYYLCLSFTVYNNKHFTLNNPCNNPFGIKLDNAIQPEIDLRKYNKKLRSIR